MFSYRVADLPSGERDSQAFEILLESKNKKIKGEREKYFLEKNPPKEKGDVSFTPFYEFSSFS